jgi:hypothetical protein
MAILWFVAPSNLVQGIVMVIVVMMEVASTSETSVNIYQAKRRNNPENSHLRTSHDGNMKSNHF